MKMNHSLRRGDEAQSHLVISSLRSRVTLSLAWTLSIALLYVSSLSGCAGNQLTPEENQRYEELGMELQKIRSERGQIEREVVQAFQKSGQVEKSKKLKGQKTLSCGYRLGGDKLGPLPFKKRKGKEMKFGSSKSSKRASCKSHTLRIK